MKELEVKASVTNLNTVLQFIDTQLEATNCSAKMQMQIDLAVEEIFVNIANYAYSPKTGSALIKVEITQDSPAIRITFIDSGIPYDPLTKDDPDITLPSDKRAIGGLGIFLVKKIMDTIHYQYIHGKNTLTIIKKLAP